MFGRYNISTDKDLAYVGAMLTQYLAEQPGKADESGSDGVQNGYNNGCSASFHAGHFRCKLL